MQGATVIPTNLRHVDDSWGIVVSRRRFEAGYQGSISHHEDTDERLAYAGIRRQKSQFADNPR